jgi:hypothetical protein
LGFTTNQSIQGLPELSPGLQFAILNVAIHNLENQDLFFNETNDIHAQLAKAASKYVVLAYSGKVGGSTETGFVSYSMPTGDSDWWGTALNVTSFDWIGANQSVNGFMYFRIEQGFAPKELICRSVGESKPVFVVDLTQ